SQILHALHSDYPHPGAVARLKTDAGRGTVKLAARAACGRRRVAVETPSRRLFAHRPAQRVPKRSRNRARVKDRDAEILERLKIADAAFVEGAVVAEDVGLAGDAPAEAEEKGFGD